MVTKEEIKAFRKEFESAVEELAKKYDLKIELGSITYDNVSFHGKMTCTKLSETGKMEVDIQAFNHLKVLYGLKANIGDTYKNWKGVTFTVTRLDTKKSKYPVIIEGSDGKTYKTSVEMVNMHMANRA